MVKVSKLETLVNLGFKNDPFKEARFKTGDSIRISRILSMAIKSKAMVSIVGDRGSGKTSAVTSVLNKMNVRQVLVRSADKNRLLISDIEQAMILDLSEERPKRGREIRARQLRRVLGEASRKEEIVLVIEEGHRIHGMTLRSLKTLREMEWMGEKELFSVILLGQSDPMNKAGVSEVRLRSDSVHMKGLTSNEIAVYIGKTVGRVFDAQAITIVSTMPDAKNFLNLQDILLQLMSQAYLTGRDRVTSEVIEEVFGHGSSIVSPREETPDAMDKSGIDTAGNVALKRALASRKHGVTPEKTISVVR